MLVDIATLRVSVIDGHWRMEGWKKLRRGCEAIEREKQRVREREREKQRERNREREREKVGEKEETFFIIMFL